MQLAKVHCYVSGSLILGTKNIFSNIDFDYHRSHDSDFVKLQSTTLHNIHSFGSLSNTGKNFLTNDPVDLQAH